MNRIMNQSIMKDDTRYRCDSVTGAGAGTCGACHLVSSRKLQIRIDHVITFFASTTSSILLDAELATGNQRTSLSHVSLPFDPVESYVQHSIS